jgi:predicted ATP-dependent Lon-type protease
MVTSSTYGLSNILAALDRASTMSKEATEKIHMSFSYTLQETVVARFVGVPEQGGRDLIYTASLQAAKDNGDNRAFIPIENKWNFLDISVDIMAHVDQIFFGDPKTAAMKVMGGLR